ncbi:peptidylprolyl isomerase [Brevundimonas lutea]|uniref:peptidylprolyl isomerase n=1 Tax=Brevundimonas lutea TaxID=2293980 RepID=UPI000F042678|nr:peptidylprolyl isomerase [Brevundimonas lutea]
MRKVVAGLAALTMLWSAGPVLAQVDDPAAWRAVAPENLLVIDTSRGRVLAELSPVAAPQTVERVRTLANQGFYDGLVFHRVIRDFMAQTGDPDGDGSGGSDLPNVPGEFSFRRGLSDPMTPVPEGQVQVGLMGLMPLTSQPDAQMFVTADNRVQSTAQFCPGVLGFARTQDANSGNSQFFIMTGENERLNGMYTAFGRVISGMENARLLKPGPDDQDGRVTDNPDTLVRVRTADQMPQGERPSARVLRPDSARAADLVTLLKDRQGLNFDVCDVELPVEVTGG